MFRVSNHQNASCGTPKGWNGDERGALLSYFQNAFGEQWVCSIETSTGIATFWCGEGWEHPFQITGDQIPMNADQAEQMWITACFMVAEELRMTIK